MILRIAAGDLLVERVLALCQTVVHIASWLLTVAIIYVVLIAPVLTIFALATIGVRRRRPVAPKPFDWGPGARPYGIDTPAEVTLHTDVRDLTGEEAQRYLAGAGITTTPKLARHFLHNLLLAETEPERIERHRRMQIGQFSPRRRHDG